MKKIYFITILAVMITAGCKPTVNTGSIDQSALNDTIAQMADKYQDAWNTKAIDVLDSLVSDDGLFFGSDPSEILDKASLLKMWAQAFSDTTTVYNYAIDIRKIKLNADGKSAIVIEQLTVADWSPRIHIRQTLQFVKVGDKWKIDFIDWAFIAKNEDVEKLNKALE